MKIEDLGDTLRISEVTEIGSCGSNSFRDQARAAFNSRHKFIEIDLSQTTFIDSCRLGALIALQKSAWRHKGTVRLLNPQPAVNQILELTRMHHIFEIAKS